MPEMKDSGIEWIGKIPVGWNIISMKYIIEGYKAGPFGSSLIMDKLNNEGDILIYTPEHIAEQNTELSSNLFLPDSRKTEMSQFFVNSGDLVFPIVGSLGRSMIITDNMPKGIINQRLAKFKLASDKVDIEFFLWLFSKSDFYSTYMELNSRGAIIQNITKGIVNGMPVVIPPKSEQNNIARFLDKKCSEIDALRTDIQSEIETLEEYKKSVITEAVTKGLDPDVEMKDSGIEWVGEIPATWPIHPVYTYFGERKAKNYALKEQNLLSLSYGRIIRKDINTNGGLLPASFNTYNIVEAGDIIIRPTDLQNDKRSLRTGLVTEHGIITSAYIDLMPIGNINSKYFHYLLHSYDVMKVFYNMGNGVRQGLNYSEFSKLMVFAPTKAEQDAIVEHLDNICSEIDATIASKKEQLATLDEYKKSIIYEYVTGKKEVPDTYE